MSKIEEVSSFQSKDHIQLGSELKLFFFDPVSPGSCFFLPHGQLVHQKLIDRIRRFYKQENYKEVVTPNIYDKKLWITSGHWDKYAENMFHIKQNAEDEANPDSTCFSLKAMNCPGHCVIFKKMNPSHRDLPLRLAEFGVLHRNEASGALRGLSRVRRFQQDDSHIFCKLEHVEGEIVSLLAFIRDLYAEFGLEYKLEISTRPEKYIGDIETWNQAEDILKATVRKFLCCDPVINEADGAFYGPKIDISMKDSLGRWNQCATIQLDFNLPERFSLGFSDADQTIKKPVMIHRALLGSLERFIAVILEHTQGHLPFWLSPRQIMILALKPAQSAYANYVKQTLLAHVDDLLVDLDDSSDDLRTKIKSAELLKYNFILVVGERESKNNSLSVRPNLKSQDKTMNGDVQLNTFIEFVLKAMGRQGKLPVVHDSDPLPVQSPLLPTESPLYNTAVNYLNSISHLENTSE